MPDLTDLRVAVVATDGFEETELTQPVAALREAGARVTILAPEPGQIQGVRHDLDKTVRIEVVAMPDRVALDQFSPDRPEARIITEDQIQ